MRGNTINVDIDALNILVTGYQMKTWPNLSNLCSNVWKSFRSRTIVHHTPS